jgi:hypothetical protein
MQINTVGRETGARQQGDSVTARIPLDTLDRLTAATSVSGTIGPTSFRLTPQQLADLREFAKRLGTSSRSGSGAEVHAGLCRAAPGDQALGGAA